MVRCSIAVFFIPWSIFVPHLSTIIKVHHGCPIPRVVGFPPTEYEVYLLSKESLVNALYALVTFRYEILAKPGVTTWLRDYSMHSVLLLKIKVLKIISNNEYDDYGYIKITSS